MLGKMFGKKKEDETIAMPQSFGGQSKDVYVCKKSMVQFAPQMNQFTTPSGQVITQPMPQMAMPATESYEPLFPLTIDNLIEILKAIPQGTETYEKFKWILVNL